MAKRGPKYKQIDQREFELLCSVQCTQAEICGVFGVDENTLNSWCKRTYNLKFSEVFKQKRSLGKTSLRRRGFKMAHENPSVHIFYAKNFLGMRDVPEQIIVKEQSILDYSKLNDDELEQLQTLLRRCSKGTESKTP